jgi:hypothetical protein
MPRGKSIFIVSLSKSQVLGGLAGYAGGTGQTGLTG